MLKNVTAIEASFYCIVYCREDTGQILLTCLHKYLDQVAVLTVRVRRPVDMILSVMNFQQKYQKQNMDLNMTFVDSVKAVDTVRRDGLWKITTTFVCPARFIAMVRQFTEVCLHDSRRKRVLLTVSCNKF